MTDRQRKSINHNNEVIDCRVQNFRIGRYEKTPKESEFNNLCGSKSLWTSVVDSNSIH